MEELEIIRLGRAIRVVTDRDIWGLKKEASVRAGSHVVVRQIDEHMVVIDPTRDAIEVRRARALPTPDDTVLEAYQRLAVRRIELYVARDGSHRLVLAIGSREGIDLGFEVTQSQCVELGKTLSRWFQVPLDIHDGDYLEWYFRERGPIMSRIHDGKVLIDAELVDPIDPYDEVSPWESESKRSGEVQFESIEVSDEFAMEDLLIEIHAELSTGYDDGPFAEPRVRTAPEVEAVYPLPTPLDPPPMSPEAEAQVRASHRPPRQPAFERRGRLAWLRACLRVLTA